ncbi:hypothetical protein Afil01_28570 [Actinorhabdospora filicis]|uniref:HTH cro/C1-type domain-containing protein n=1 Tax=Actinorhabdospora filicis TaxID=1785913 RepID=A0A9W6WAV6_9ACTN|nr:helix-turn-helix transcriptional regulator [Actinorhabdospora filicis]GLZ78050.1 hypothetical protein Afil01_28570 [Actinorhabdospora filicis]
MPITRTGHALGRRLRRLRKAAHLSLRDVAATSIVTGPSTLLRLEEGERTRMTFPTIGALARLYGAPPELCVELEEMFKAAQRDKPWSDDFTGNIIKGFSWFLEMEAQAESMKIYAPDLVIGLLQTRDYAEALSRQHDADDEQLRDWMTVLERRWAAVWERDPAPGIKVLMGEWALRGRVSEEQTARLRSAGAEVRVLPIADGPYPFLRGPFTLLTFSGSEDEPDCLYTEGLEGSRYEEDHETTALYHRVFDRMFGKARRIEEF